MAKRCTDVLIAYRKIREDQRAVYIYGFELLFSTFGCFSCILMLGIIFGYIKSAIFFVMYFLPIRMAGGGYHAKSYAGCFLLTNSIALFCIAFSKSLWSFDNVGIEALLWLGFGIAVIIMWQKSPIIPEKYIGKTNRYSVNRRYAHIILCIEAIFLLMYQFVFNNEVVYTAIITSYAVTVMMLQIRKGGE